MPNLKDIALVCLLQSGLTHNDLKKLFLEETTYSPEYVWKSLKNKTILGETPTDRGEKIIEKSQKIDQEAIQKLLDQKSIHIVDIHDTEYPSKLRNIGHAPYFLFVRGTIRSDFPMIGIVGSRKSTQYAQRVLEKIIPDTLEAGIGIISGGATGVDSIAHHITLDHGGYTIVVFGTGIDRCYPAGNKILFEKVISSGGAIISHFPLGTGPELYNFPIRNEIVAGISDGILIPEAALSSGTLITAQLALEHGRDVFAIPGDIDRVTSEGSNMLIATGQAKIVRCSGDILEEYFDLQSIGSGMTPIVKIPPVFENEQEKILYESLENGYTTIDMLLGTTNIPMTEILTTLAMLEIRGVISLTEMGKYEIL